MESSTSIYAYAVVLMLLAAIATIENVVVIIVICKNEVLRTPTIFLLGILAIVDLITASIVTPIKIWLTVVEVSFRSILSLLYTFLWLFMGVVFFSLSTVLMISLDRFLQVYFLERYTLTMKKLAIGLAMCWITPLVITVCLAIRHYKVWIAWVALVFFLFCIIAMIVAYVGMIVTLQKHTSNITEATILMTRKCIEDQRKAVRTTLIIIITCIVMNLPPVLSIGFGFMGISFSRTLCAITYFALLGNAAVNPIIYCSRVTVIKKHVLQFLHIKRFTDNDEESEDYLTVVADREI